MKSHMQQAVTSVTAMQQGSGFRLHPAGVSRWGQRWDGSHASNHVPYFRQTHCTRAATRKPPELGPNPGQSYNRIKWFA